MHIKLVTIGNSKGVRLPRPVLEQVGFTDGAELSVESGRIVLMPVASDPRVGWEQAFADDPVRNEAEASEWLEAGLTDTEEWTW